MSLSPVVIFVYNRPKHTQLTIEALRNNTLASQSEIFIYSDAPQSEESVVNVSEVRRYIRSVSGFKRITIIERETNLGLAESIMSAVTEVVDKYGKVIVLEDDLITAKSFLTYMNDALDFYDNHDAVWHISGWNYPVNSDVSEEEDVFLWRGMNCWGWATWSKKWSFFERNPKKLLDSFSKADIKRFNIDGYQNFWQQVIENNDLKVKTWAVFWYASIFTNNGLCVNPFNSLVLNIGVDGSGSNSGDIDYYQSELSGRDNFKFTRDFKENRYALKKIKLFNRSLKPVYIYFNGVSVLLGKIKTLLKYTYKDIRDVFNLYWLRMLFPDSIISSNVQVRYQDINLVKLNRNSYIGSFTTIHVTNYSDKYNNSYFELGENSYLGELNNIRAAGGNIIIGKNCLISQQVSMIAANHHISRGLLIRDQSWDESKNGIVICDDVWIGANSVILPGVTIKKGAVIGAGSVVSQDVEEYSIVVGSPAKSIRVRD